MAHIRHRSLVAATVTTLIVPVIGPAYVQAAPADNDPAWGSGNRIALSYAIQVESSAQVVRPDGTTFVVGEAVSDALGGPVVTKLGPAGVDTSFGTGGTARLAPPNPQFSDVVAGHMDAVLQQGSGRLVVAGSRGGTAGWTVVAMTDGGDLDTTFGTGGTAHIGTVSGHLADGVAPRLLATPDGSLLVVGFALDPNQRSVPAAVKLTATGQIDNTFGAGGIAVATVPTAPDTIGLIGGATLDAAGRILMVGLTPTAQWVLVRWTSSGALDSTFDGDGLVLGNDRKCAADVTVDGQNRPIVACSQGPTRASNPQVALVRYRVDGTVDTTFGDNGLAAVPPHSPNGYTEAASIAMQGGKIVVAGRISDEFIGAFNPSSDVGTWRFTEGGQLDRGFGAAAGVVRDDFAARDSVKDVVALPDGRLQVLATSSTGPVAPQTAVYRYRPATVPAVPSMQALERPERLLDTRIGVGAPVGKVGPQADLQLTVVGVGQAQIPTDAVAVAINVTATATESPGFVTVYPCGTDRPVASNLNFAPNDTIPNLVIARVGDGGRVCIHASSPAHIVADVVAFYGARSDLRPLDVPTRRIDTRSGLGMAAPGQIGGTVGAALPATAAGDRQFVSELVLNVTVTDPQGPGFVTVYQCGTERPVASNLNFRAGQTIANLVVARATDTGNFPAGAVCFYASAPTHLVVDVLASLDVGSAHRPLARPARLLDTRDGLGAPLGPYRANDVLQLDVTGLAGVPDDATAVALNVTVTQPQTDGYLTVYPCGQEPPLASNLNFERGETIPNLVITKVGAGGAVCITGIANTHILADLAEWYPAVS